MSKLYLIDRKNFREYTFSQSKEHIRVISRTLPAVLFEEFWWVLPYCFEVLNYCENVDCQITESIVTLVIMYTALLLKAE